MKREKTHHNICDPNSEKKSQTFDTHLDPNFDLARLTQSINQMTNTMISSYFPMTKPYSTKNINNI